MSELKPYPFCGGEAENSTRYTYVYDQPKKGDLFFNAATSALCSNCKIETRPVRYSVPRKGDYPDKSHYQIAEAIVSVSEMWNTRPTDKLARARAEIEKITHCGVMRSMTMTTRANTAKEILKIIDDIANHN